MRENLLGRFAHTGKGFQRKRLCEAVTARIGDVAFCALAIVKIMTPQLAVVATHCDPFARITSATSRVNALKRLQCRANIERLAYSFEDPCFCMQHCSIGRMDADRGWRQSCLSRG